MIAGLPTRADVTEAWVQRYSNVVSNSNDQAVKIVRDAAGDVIVTGTTDTGITGSGMLTIKYSGGDGTVIWQKRYDGPTSDFAVAGSLAVDGSGNVVVTGYSFGSASYDFYTAKYAAADGALLWEQRQNTRSGRHIFASAAAVDGAGNVVVTGTSYGSTSYDFYTAKYAAVDGALLWEHRYDGPANRTDEAASLAVDGNGNVVVTGRSVGSEGNDDYYTAKYAAVDGALLWDHRYNSPVNSSDFASGLAVDASGNVVVTGTSFNGTDFNFPSDYYTAKYAAADGALLWERRYNGPARGTDFANAVAVDASGNVVVTGSSVGSSLTYDYYTAKYAAATGQLLWEKRHTGSAKERYDEARALAVDGNGNVVVTGFWWGRVSEDQPNLVSGYYTAKYAAADGALLWEKRYSGQSVSPNTGNDKAEAVAVDGSGDVVVTGTSSSDYYTAKYAVGDGTLLWEQRYNGLFHGDAHAQAVVVDSTGSVVVTGSANNGPSNFGDGSYTAKYAASNGTLLWEKRASNGGAAAVAVDGSGNVVVTGYSSTPDKPWPERQDYYTAKYAAANGALLWEQRYDAGYGQARAVAVDASGNVMVTGGTGLDGLYGRFLAFYTAKYAAADGALLWEKRYGGPNGYGSVTNGYGSAVNGSYGAAAMAIDGSGNVVVTGTSGNDYYTAKYANANGALLWEKRYSNPGNTVGLASAVAVDATGNVVVTGTSGNDYYTAKYAAADGALLWEKRYGEPLNGGDKEAVTVDASGNIIVTGGYYTTKFAAADGTLLWEELTDNDLAQAVAVDGSDNVVVAGTSDSGDYYTAKYAAADGALIWEKRYNGPANGDDRVGSGRSLALGPNGMIVVAGTSSNDYATVAYWENLPPISAALVPTGLRLRFPGVPGRNYTIERARAVTGPWITLATPTTPPGGLLDYTDPNPPEVTAFYRTSVP